VHLQRADRAGLEVAEVVDTPPPYLELAATRRTLLTVVLLSVGAVAGEYGEKTIDVEMIHLTPHRICVSEAADETAW
jgi:hypothetical protein